MHNLDSFKLFIIYTMSEWGDSTEAPKVTKLCNTLYSKSIASKMHKSCKKNIDRKSIVWYNTIFTVCSCWVGRFETLMTMALCQHNQNQADESPNLWKLFRYKQYSAPTNYCSRANNSDKCQTVLTFLLGESPIMIYVSPSCIQTNYKPK